MCKRRGWSEKKVRAEEALAGHVSQLEAAKLRALVLEVVITRSAYSTSPRAQPPRGPLRGPSPHGPQAGEAVSRAARKAMIAIPARVTVTPMKSHL